MDFTEIGVVVKPHGLSGSMVILLEASFYEQALSFDTIYLEQFGSYVPYKVLDKASLNGGKAKFLLQGIDSAERAEMHRKTKVFQITDELQEHEILDLEGWTVVINDLAEATITRQIDNTSQVLLEIEDEKGRQFLIPLVDEFIKSVKEEERRIEMEVPDGLLDL